MAKGRSWVLGVGVGLALLVAGCSGPQPADEGGKEGRVVVTAWFHTGRQAEQRVMADQVARFNRSQEEIQVRLTMIPEGGYNTQVQAAAASDSLPDVLDLDGPYLANYVWKGHLRPLDDLLPAGLLQGLLPSVRTQGTVAGRLYAVGTFDSGLGLWGRRSRLLAVGARLPARPEAAWTADEFDGILGRLAAADDDGAVLDLRLDYRGEWYTYAFSPILQSAGADLVARSGPLHAAGVLDSPPAIQAMQRVQGWFRHRWVDANVDGNAFASGRVALSWCGHWVYPRYRDAVGDDLVLLPLPDFGHGSRTGMGSWCWAVSRRCRHPEAAARFIAFLLRDDEILRMCAANGAVPASRTAIRRSVDYQAGGPLHLFVVQLERTSVPRPRTAAYPVISAVFQQAFADIRFGEDVAAVLARAAKAIDRDILDNQGYVIPAEERP